MKPKTETDIPKTGDGSYPPDMDGKVNREGPLYVGDRLSIIPWNRSLRMIPGSAYPWCEICSAYHRPPLWFNRQQRREHGMRRPLAEYV